MEGGEGIRLIPPYSSTLTRENTRSRRASGARDAALDEVLHESNGNLTPVGRDTVKLQAHMRRQEGRLAIPDAYLLQLSERRVKAMTEEIGIIWHVR